MRSNRSGRAPRTKCGLFVRGDRKRQTMTSTTKFYLLMYIAIICYVFLLNPYTLWQPVTGGSAATLLGLLFVAVSIHVSTARDGMHQDSKRLGEQSFQNYLV